MGKPSQMCVRALVVLLALASGSSGADDKPPGPRFPARVSRYDLATQDELLYAHWVSPFVQGDDVSKWSWISDLVNQVGTWSGGALDANRIADAIHNGLPIDGQKPLARLDALVKECARVLGVTAPTVIVRNAPETRAYLVATDKETLLVMTSGLLKLYDNSEDELRFVVGRELGRIKCEHLKIRRAAYGLLAATQAINRTVVPAEAQSVLPTLFAGRLLTWSRESEISVDRAGLICCGSPKTAVASLTRLLHGLDKQAKILDPDNPEFDSEKIIQQFQRWEHEPFVKFVTYIQSQPAEVPFIAERLAALKQFVDSGQYAALLSRPAKGDAEHLVIIEEIELIGLAEANDGVWPYLRCAVGDKTQFRTPTHAWSTQAKWKNIKAIVSETSGDPIFLEVFNDARLGDYFVGGAVLYPNVMDVPKAKDRSGPGEVTYTARLLWDWKDRSTVMRTGLARVRVRFAATESKP